MFRAGVSRLERELLREPIDPIAESNHPRELGDEEEHKLRASRATTYRRGLDWSFAILWCVAFWLLVGLVVRSFL